VLSADGRQVYLLAAATTNGHRSIRVLELDARTTTIPFPGGVPNAFTW
jgi:hypothetical protein